MCFLSLINRGFMLLTEESVKGRLSLHYLGLQPLSFFLLVFSLSSLTSTGSEFGRCQARGSADVSGAVACLS